MSRGFKRDRSATVMGGFVDPRSFVSQPKIIEGECDVPKEHLVLYGKDKSPMRAAIFHINRKANGGINRCARCGRVVLEHGPLGAPTTGQWHHVRNKPGERCDDVENGIVYCGPCHFEEHN